MAVLFGLRCFDFAVLLGGLLLQLTFEGALAQQTLKLSATLTLERTDDKAKTFEQVSLLASQAKEKKLESNVVRFLDNMVTQLQKVMDAAKVVEKQKETAVPKDFTPAKYKVKSIPKLKAKKETVKKIAAKDLRKRLKEGGNINFDAPLLVTNATALFEDGDWDKIRRHWSASRIASDEKLEQTMRIEYWAPDKARARLVGNMVQMEEPDMVKFSRYLVICHHGTPAKPMLPGQNTEHCEQTMDATEMAHNNSELQELAIFPEIKNALSLQAEFRRRMLEAGSAEISVILGSKKAEKWKTRSGKMAYRYFVFGPSGSGDKLHAENGLPFYDVLIHGSRRWLLLTDDEMERVAKKAREALEFDKTSAYMFFEEKLPELIDEFGLKKYVEANQQAGDLVIVPSGWYRVSLSLADSISYYETILSEKETLAAVTDNNVWNPNYRQYQLAFCYSADEMHTLPGVEKGSQFYNWLKDAISKVKNEELISSVLQLMLQCGSTLALDAEMPELGVKTLSSCTPAVWKKCRKTLVSKLKPKGVTLAWIPEEAPTSLDSIGPGAAAEKAPKQEL